MLTGQKIVVCVAECPWTERAIHLASALARDTGGEICLVRLVPVDHAFQLGAPYAHWHYTTTDREEMQTYLETLQRYGVSFCSYIFQYVSYLDALVSLSEQLHARVMFALPRHHLVSYWTRFETWNLRRRLARRHCVLYTLDARKDALLWPPTPLVQGPQIEQPHQFSHS